LTDKAVAAIASDVANAFNEANKADKVSYEAYMANEAGKAVAANEAHKANEVNKTNEADKASKSCKARVTNKAEANKAIEFAKLPLVLTFSLAKYTTIFTEVKGCFGVYYNQLGGLKRGCLR
jgi:hypothetical protein